MLFVSFCASSTVLRINAASSATSVPPVAEWEKFYGEGEGVFQVIQTSDDGFAFIGTGRPHMLFKVDSSGNMQWNKTINLFHPAGLVQTTDGEYAIAGVAGAGVALIKTDCEGNLKWNQTYYTQSESNEVASMVKTNDGGFAISCNTYTYGRVSVATLIKTDTSGKLQWQKTYGEPGNINSVDHVVQTSDGGYALAGSTSFNGKTNSPNLYFWLVKTDSYGNLKWNRFYGTGPDTVNTNSTINAYSDQGLNRRVAGDNEAKSVVQTADGGYVLAGLSYPQNYGVTLLVKTDSMGNMEWNKTYGGPGNPPFTPDYAANSLIQTSDGGLAFAGSKLRFVDNGFTIVWLVKTDIHGNMQWEQTYGPGWEATLSGANSLIETRDGSLVMAGFSAYYYYLVKTEPNLPPPTPSPSIGLTSYPSSTPLNAPPSTVVVIVAVVVIVILAALFLVYGIRRKKAKV